MPPRLDRPHRGRPMTSVRSVAYSCALCGHRLRSETEHVDPMRDEGHRPLPVPDRQAGNFSRHGGQVRT